MFHYLLSLHTNLINKGRTASKKDLDVFAVHVEKCRRDVERFMEYEQKWDLAELSGLLESIIIDIMSLQDNDQLQRYIEDDFPLLMDQIQDVLLCC